MISDFFIWCSGANKSILKRCPTEQTKFIGIGATILLTAILASISGGYAIHFTFNNYSISILMGIFWGIVIFNLDRYIVSSIRKTGKFRQEFFMALPRIVIALILGITISKPLETRLFGATINKKLAKTEDLYNADCERDFNSRRDTLDKTKLALQAEMNNARNNIFNTDPVIKDANTVKLAKVEENKNRQEQININQAIIARNRILTAIRSPEGRIIRKWKYNDIAKQKIAENKQLNAERGITINDISVLDDSSNSRRQVLAMLVGKTEREYTDQITGIQNQIDDLNNQRPEIIAKCKKDAGGNKDILDRLNALGQLKSFGNTVWLASWLITLIFVLLEAAPVTVKLLSKRGPYDEILDGIEDTIADNEKKKELTRKSELENLKIEVKDINEKKKTYRLNVEQEKLDIELQANKDLMTKIAEKQVSLTEDIIDNWYNDQRSKYATSAAKQGNSFVDKLWKTVNSADEILYIFKNGQPGQNELVYMSNGKHDKGTWEYIATGELLKMELSSIKKEYEITELTTSSMKLKSQAGEIELQTV
ncbi:MAG TPA: DUF4407 domain-containing protein [Chitinophagaceae bacterium]|nr:DUF4407 domain-containing protein [Chitinophagaceae bacterium]